MIHFPDEVHVLTHNEMVGLQAEEHELVKTSGFSSDEEYVLHLMHAKPYEVAAKLAVEKRALDLGCNNGYGTYMLGERAARAVGVDVSERAIAAATLAHPPLEFRVIDGKTLPFPERSFDLVVSFQVIEHVVDLSTYVRELKRVMDAGALAVFTTPNACIRLYPGMKPWNRFHVREYTGEELRPLLTSYFRHVDVFGMFGEEPLHSIETRRVAAARDAARTSREQSVSAPILSRARRILQEPFARIARRLARVTGRGHARARAIHGGCLAASLRYESGDLRRALDLLAICSDDARTFESARRLVEERSGSG